MTHQLDNQKGPEINSKIIERGKKKKTFLLYDTDRFFNIIHSFKGRP